MRYKDFIEFSQIGDFIDIDDAPDTAPVSEKIERGELLVAEGCVYSRDDLMTKLNNNVLVVGGSGTGKTRSVVIPNMLRCGESLMICAPKGGFAKKYAKRLKKMGYNIIHLDFAHPEKSMRYNPLEGIKTTQDILTIVNTLVYDKAALQSRADPFWDLNATVFMSAIIGYMVEADYQPKNFASLLQLCHEGTRKDDDDFDSVLARRFAALKRKNPNSWACQRFEEVNVGSVKTYDCVRMTVTSKFAKLDTEELRMMMSGNDFDFTSAAKEKTAAFVTVSDTDRSMDALVNIFFTQAMQQLCDYADNETEDGRLPIPVNFILDDFATICRIDEFPRMISTIRSRGISAMLLLQSEAQLEQSYGFDAKTIIANCDTYAYLGGNDVKTAQAVSERCNKPMNQVLNMPIGSCWVFRRGEPPVFTKLLDPTEYTRDNER